MSTPDGAVQYAGFPDLKDVERATTDVFSGVAGTRLYMVPRSDGGKLEQVVIEMVTSNYFEVLGLRPGLGRLIEPQGCPGPGHRYGGRRDAVVLEAGVRRRSRVIGQTIHLSGAAYTIIGVAPADFPGSIRGIGIDAFVPITMSKQLAPSEPDPVTDFGDYFMWGKARLRDGVTARACAGGAGAGRDRPDRAPAEAAWTMNDRFHRDPVQRRHHLSAASTRCCCRSRGC